MPPEGTAGPPDKLSLVVFSGRYEKVHYALAMASAAVAVNKPATLFFTMEAIRGLGKEDGAGNPGWHALRAEDGRAARARDEDFAARGVATFEQLLGSCAELGVTFMVCETGLRAVGLTAGDLRRDIAVAEGGIVSFLHDASAHGALVFI